MTSDETFPLIAVDVGNSRVKLGLFANAPPQDLPTPVRTLSLAAWDAAQVERWLQSAAPPANNSTRSPATPPARPLHWHLCSVNRPSSAMIVRWLETQPGAVFQQLDAADLPLTVNVEHPDLVGIDRLVDAVAVNRLREPNRPAIVIDVGTAITVDLVLGNGAFAGGAILPGIGLSARALHDFTDLLPLIPMSELGVPPPALGTATIPALRSGLYWGAVGAMRELITRLGAGLPTPQVFLTGGAAPAVASLLTAPDGQPAEFVPHLTLAGVTLAAAHIMNRGDK